MKLGALLLVLNFTAFASCAHSKTVSGDLFVKPFMYGTAIVILAILIAVVFFIYGMSDERDPLIYSKFLTVKKKTA